MLKMTSCLPLLAISLAGCDSPAHETVNGAMNYTDDALDEVDATADNAAVERELREVARPRYAPPAAASPPDARPDPGDWQDTQQNKSKPKL
jgi:hypothetical protein